MRALGLKETPWLEGVCDGELVSSYQDTVVPIRLTIGQTWTLIVLKLEELGNITSTSKLVAAALNRSGHDSAHLTYTYKSSERPGVAEADMSDHDGTADLDFDLTTGGVAGPYFNARPRNGTMTLAKVP